MAHRACELARLRQSTNTRVNGEGPGPIGESQPFESKRGQALTDCSAKSVIRCFAAVETLLRGSTPQQLLSQRPPFGKASAPSPVEPRVSREW
jgi:hypothetical protein